MATNTKNIIVLGASSNRSSSVPKYKNVTDLELFQKRFPTYTVEGIDKNGKLNPDYRCYIADFNDVNTLLQLDDSKYDLIVFDRATANFLEWTEDHLIIIKNKLKPGGKLYLPQICTNYALLNDKLFSRPVSMYNVKQWLLNLTEPILNYKQYLNEANRNLFVGLNAPMRLYPKSLQSTCTQQAFIRYMQEYITEIVQNHNITLLTKVFGSSSVCLEENNYPTRVDIDPQLNYREYYVLINDPEYTSLPTEISLMDIFNLRIKLQSVLNDNQLDTKETEYFQIEINRYRYILDIVQNQRVKNGIEHNVKLIEKMLEEYHHKQGN